MSKASTSGRATISGTESELDQKGTSYLTDEAQNRQRGTETKRLKARTTSNVLLKGSDEGISVPP
ncbi:unnamed protein product, partial [Amoebophrya sp. A25]|eukprot:GSA25T00007849001.1